MSKIHHMQRWHACRLRSWHCTASRCTTLVCIPQAHGSLRLGPLCRDVGQAIGWASSAFYLGSRVAQIVKNASRGSAEGLSLAMFACAMTANCLYGGGILLRSYDWATVLRSSPWLLGRLASIFAQYGNHCSCIHVWAHMQHCSADLLFALQPGHGLPGPLHLLAGVAVLFMALDATW